jgi:hypothetical protein
MVYQAALRVELTERLGVRWGPVDRHGQADIDGVPVELAKLFSKRTAQVEPRAEQLIAEAEAGLGRGLTAKGRARFYEVAVLETRTVKDHTGEDDRGLFDRWRTEAAAAGFDPNHWVAPVIDRDRPDTGLDREAVVAEVLAELAGSQSTWTRTDVVRHLARRVPVGLGDAGEARAWIETTADEVLADRSIVRLAAPEPTPPGDLRRRDGRSVFERHAATRYCTDATLAVEQHVLDIATAGRGAGRGVVNRVAVDAVIAHNGLGDDQAAVVRSVTQDGDTVACVVGPAGTGKSHTMAAAAHAWAATGIPVRGLAVSAAAAGVLQAGTGIAADTVAKFLHEHDRPAGPGPDWRLRSGEVLVVDEASMVPSTDLARLIVLAEEAGGKVVLVGDWAQLGAVEAGGLFRLLAHDHNVELSGVRRITTTGNGPPASSSATGPRPSWPSTRTTAVSWAVPGRRSSPRRSPGGSRPAPRVSRWWCAPATTPPSPTSPPAAGRPGSRPARSNRAVSPPGVRWSGWATRSSPPATTAAYSPPATPGSATVTAGTSTPATPTAASPSPT